MYWTKKGTSLPPLPPCHEGRGGSCPRCPRASGAPARTAQTFHQKSSFSTTACPGPPLPSSLLCVCCGRVDKVLASTSDYWSLCFVQWLSLGLRIRRCVCSSPGLANGTYGHTISTNGLHYLPLTVTPSTIRLLLRGYYRELRG